MAPAVIQKLLRDRPADWFQDYNELLLRCLSDGVEEGRRMQGRDVKRWRYGKYTELQIAHPVGHRLPLVSGWFDIGPVPMSGSSTSVKQTTRRLGPSMRMAADLADWEHSLLNVTVGQSGHVLSSHYRDEWTGYYYARSYPMQFGRVDSRDVLEMIPE